MKLVNPPGAEDPADIDPIDSGLTCLAAVCGYYFISVDPKQIAHELGLGSDTASA